MASKWKVIFVLGAPGVGKGTQCKLLTENYKISHISVGDVLRDELEKPNSQWAELIRANMLEGRVGPPHMTVALLKEAMAEKAEKEGIFVFLVDGFPRSLDRIPLFESTICAPSLVISLDCPVQILQERLLARAKLSGRIDDSLEIMTKRFQKHLDDTKPVINHYKMQGLAVEIDASKNVAEVYKDVRLALGGILTG